MKRVFKRISEELGETRRGGKLLRQGVGVVGAVGGMGAVGAVRIKRVSLFRDSLFILTMKNV